MDKHELTKYLKKIFNHLIDEGKSLLIELPYNPNDVSVYGVDRFNVAEFCRLLLREAESLDDIEFIIYDNKIVVSVEDGWKKGEVVGTLIVGEGN